MNLNDPLNIKIQCKLHGRDMCLRNSRKKKREIKINKPVFFIDAGIRKAVHAFYLSITSKKLLKGKRIKNYPVIPPLDILNRKKKP